MKGRTKRSLLAIATGLLALGLTAVGSGAAPQNAASGHGTLLRADENGDMVRRQFSFSARREADGTVTGNAVLVNPAFTVGSQPYRLHVDITCMYVVGNIAVFGGTTERTNDPGLVDAVFFTVQDNGEPGAGRDQISSVFFWDDDPATVGDPQACLLTAPLAFPLEPIESGNIQVR